MKVEFKAFLLAFSLLFLVLSCADDDSSDGSLAGAGCSNEGAKVCASDGSAILICQHGTLSVVKNCNLNFGEYCRVLESGPSCKDAPDSSNDNGDTDSLGDTGGNTDSSVGDTGSDGDTGSSGGDTGNTGDDGDTGNTGSDVGDSGDDSDSSPQDDELGCKEIIECTRECTTGQECIEKCYNDGTLQGQKDYTEFWECNGDCQGNFACIYENCEELGLNCGVLKKADSSYNVPYGKINLNGVFKYIVTSADGNELSGDKINTVAFATGTLGSGNYNNPAQEGIFAYARQITSADEDEFVQIIQQPYSNGGQINLNPIVLVYLPATLSAGEVNVGLTSEDPAEVLIADVNPTDGKISCIHGFVVGKINLTEFNTATGAAGRITFSASDLDVFSPKNAPIYGGDISNDKMVACPVK
ncbi:MAG: hypothetical protein ACOX2F_07775 [bacterium]